MPTAPGERARSLATLIAVALVALSASRVAADEEPSPRGLVRVEGWAVNVDEDDGADSRGGGALRSHLDLTDDVDLDLVYARSFVGYQRDHDLGYAQAEWKALRVGGGKVGDDYGLHVGFGPRGTFDPARWIRLEAGFDLALGAGWLGDHDDEERLESIDPATGAQRAWRSASSSRIDLVSARSALDLAVRLRPVEVIELTLGAYVDAMVVAGRPTDEDGLPDALKTLAQNTDLGLSATLSQGAVGAHGSAGVRLYEDACLHGNLTEVWLRYREAWDWIHLDPLYTVLAAANPFTDVTLAQVPIRMTRTVELTASRGWSGRGQVSATVDVRHVTGSTTSQDFADRDGYSVGGRVGGRYRRLFAALEARYHLQDSELEDVLGEMPRVSVGGRAGVLLVSSADVDVGLEAGGEYGRQDDWGVPRDGWSAHGALTVAFGGARDLLDEEVMRRGLSLPPLPRRAPLTTGRFEPGAEPGPIGFSTEGFDDYVQLSPDEQSRISDSAKESGLTNGDIELEELDRFLDDNPDLVAQVEQALPGVTDLVDRMIESGTVDLTQVTLDPNTALFAGYGTDSAGLGLTWREGPTLSRTFRLRDPAPGQPLPSLDDVPARYRAMAGLSEEEEREAQESFLAGETSLYAGGMLDLAHARRWQKLTVARPDGDHHRLVFQGTTSWVRAMRLLLSGR